MFGLRLGGMGLIPRRSGASWTPLTLFLAGEQGGWYDPTDLTTMFQDSAGTTPVTAVEQPVGLWLDKRLGALSALGPELVTNGTFDAGTDGWTGNNSTLSVSSSALIVTSTSTNNIYAGQTVPVTPTKTYRYSARIFAPSANVGVNVARAFLYTNSSLGVPIIFSASNAASSEDAWLEVVAFFTATTSSVFVQLGVGSSVAWGANGDTARFDNVSIREVPGNHLIQPTSASRPTYSKRYNLLERTQEFDNAAWVKNAGSVSANAATAPDGTNTADKLVENTASTTHEVKQDVTTTAVSHTFSVFLKAAERTFAMLYHGNTNSAQVINLTTGAAAGNAGLGSPVSSAIENSGNGWWKVSITVNATAAVNNFRVYPLTNSTTYNYTGDGASGILIWGADLRRTIHTTMGMPAYQRVTTATDYDESGFLPRLRFDGADDSMYTATSVNFTATDEMTVLAGLTKLSDAASGIVVELTDVASNLPRFSLQAPGSSAANYRFDSAGTSNAPAITPSVFSAPRLNVLSGFGDISGDLSQIRVNAGIQTTTTSDQGTGPYSNAVLYIGRRNNASLPFNGDIFQLIVRGALTSGATLTSAEQYVAQRTGVTLP